MKLVVIGTWNGKKVFNWSLAVLWIVLTGCVAALAALLIYVVGDNVQLLPRADLDLLTLQSVLVPLTMFFAGILPLGFRWCKPLDQLPNLEKAPPRFLIITPISLRALLQKMLFGVVTLITLVALFYAVENWRGKRAFMKHQRELVARGLALDIEGNIPAPVPDAQNLAMIPLFKGLLDYERGSNGIIWHDPSSEQRLKKVEKLFSNSGKGKTHFPDAANLLKNNLVSLPAYQAFFRDSTNATHTAAPQSPAEDILLALSTCESERNELMAAAATHPLTRFPIHYNENVSTLLPHLARVKSLIQYLYLHAAACLELGRVNEAFEDLQLTCRLADIPRTEPFLVSQLVRSSWTSFSIQILKEGLTRHSWTDGQLRWMQDYCLKADLLEDVAHALDGERALSIAGLDLMRRNQLSMQAVLSEENQEAYKGILQSAVTRMIPSGWYYQNMLSVSQFYEQYTKKQIQPAEQRVDKAQVQTADTALQQIPTTPYTLFAKIFTPSLFRACISTARWQTALNHAAIACALERYRLAHQSYPQDLQALQPQFIEKFPRDVMNGQPHSYRLEGDNYLLYSVGWNLTDEGGKVGASAAGSLANNEKGDWVWSLTPTPPVKLP